MLQVRERLLILPIIGVLDSQRARQLTEQLLRGIRANRAKVVVIDITGVPTIDSTVANHLVQTVEASRLMGASVIITGLSSEIAQTLVTIGVDLSKINAVGDLQGGIEEAERLLGYEVSTGRRGRRRSRAAGPGRSMAVPILKQGAFLIASIQSALTDTDVLAPARRRRCAQVGRFRSRGIIVDVTALDVMDSFVVALAARHRPHDAPARRRDRHRRHPARGRVRDGAARHELRGRRTRRSTSKRAWRSSSGSSTGSPDGGGG